MADNISVDRLEQFAEFYGSDFAKNPVDYRGIAEAYRRWGEHYEIRWDYAFFQMLLETGFLQFGAGVSADHYNFAGIGAVVTGKAGQTFANLDEGVKAHIQHLAVYRLRWIDDNEFVSPYTRKVRDWIFQVVAEQLGRPAGFDDLGEEYPGDRVAWSVGHPHYAKSIELIARRYDRWLEIQIGQELLMASFDGPGAAPEANPTVTTGTPSRLRRQGPRRRR